MLTDSRKQSGFQMRMLEMVICQNVALCYKKSPKTNCILSNDVSLWSIWIIKWHRYNNCMKVQVQFKYIYKYIASSSTFNLVSSCRCSSLLRGRDTHPVPGPPGCRANGTVQPCRPHPHCHSAGQRPGPLGASAIFLWCTFHRQEAPIPALPEKGMPPVS